ncbi:MAG: type II toxin-antitoxin system prevent-host-death family antitoxin [Candidatus Berkelbacteria bacterium]
MRDIADKSNMKQITVNKLQSEISKVIREVEAGEVYEINRYSDSVAFLISKEKFAELSGGDGCKACMKDLRKIAKKLT